MSNTEADTAAGATDEELWRAYAGDDPVASGEASLLLYGRYRDRVRAALEGAGLVPEDAEARVGEVFRRALEGPHSGDITLSERLERHTREVAPGPHGREVGG